MSYRAVRFQDDIFGAYFVEVFVEHHLVIDHRPYLQQMELSRLVVVDVGCELYLHGSFHLLRAVVQHALQNLGQRQHAMLHDAGE